MPPSPDSDGESSSSTTTTTTTTTTTESPSVGDNAETGEDAGVNEDNAEDVSLIGEVEDEVKKEGSRLDESPSKKEEDSMSGSPALPSDQVPIIVVLVPPEDES